MTGSLRVDPAARVRCGRVFARPRGNAWYNAYRFGSPLASGYQFSEGESFITPLWTGLYGLLLSPFRGLFWFSPVLLAAIPGTVMTWRRDPRVGGDGLGHGADLSATVQHVVDVVGRLRMGAALLLPVVPFMLLLAAPLWELRRWRGIVAVLAAISFVVQVLAVSADFTLTETVIESTFGQPAQSAAMVDPRWSPIVLQAVHLRQGFWDIAWVSLGAVARPVLAGGVGAVVLALLALWAAPTLSPVGCRNDRAERRALHRFLRGRAVPPERQRTSTGRCTGAGAAGCGCGRRYRAEPATG